MDTTYSPGHVGLNVTDLARSIDFYREVFGFDLVEQREDGEHRWASLAHDGRLVLTLWQQAGGRFSPHTAGLHHLSFEVPTIDDVRAAEVRLGAMEAEFAYEGVVPHDASSESGGIFFADPDGTRLEIYAPAGAGHRPAPHSHAPTCGFF